MKRAFRRPNLLHNSGCYSRATVHSKQVALESGVLIFDLARCCAGVGLLECKGVPGLPQEIARDRWGGDVQRFLSSVHEFGIKQSLVKQCALSFRGVVIGWTLSGGSLDSEDPGSLCADLLLTLTVLSHRSSDLFLPRREPLWTWKQLFGVRFALSDARFSGTHPSKTHSPSGS